MNQLISNAIIIAILAVILFFAVRSSLAHFKGEGGCCGGGGGIKKVKPRKLANVLTTKTMTIEGMICENCSARVHNALNSIEGVSAKVSRSKNQAVIRLDRQIDDQVLEKVVSDLGYTVKAIV